MRRHNMREVIQTIQLYKFDELDKVAQRHVIDQNRYKEVEYLEWYDSTMDYLKGCLKDFGLSDIEIQFQGFYNQWCSASITASFDSKSIDLNKIKELCGNVHNSLELPNMELISIYGVYCHFKNDSSRYCRNVYSHDMDIPSIQHVLDESEYKGTVYHFTIDLFERIEQELITLINDLAHWCYTMLESEYEYLTSDEHIRAVLIDYDEEYTSTGEVY